MSCLMSRYGVKSGRPFIVSRSQHALISGWAQDYPRTRADVTRESHDQKKSRLIRQHKDAMDKAFKPGGIW